MLMIHTINDVSKKENPNRREDEDHDPNFIFTGTIVDFERYFKKPLMYGGNRVLSLT